MFFFDLLDGFSLMTNTGVWPEACIVVRRKRSTGCRWTRRESAPRPFGVYLTQIINIYLAQRHPRIMIQSQCINSTGSLFFGVIIQDNYQRHKKRYKLQIAECQEYAMCQSRSIQSENRMPSSTSPSSINFFPPLCNFLHSSRQFLVHSNLFLNLAFFSGPFVYFCTSIGFSF